MDPIEASPSGKQDLSIVVKSLRLWEQEAEFPRVSLGVTVCGAASMGSVGAPLLANAEWGIAHQPRAMVRRRRHLWVFLSLPFISWGFADGLCKEQLGGHQQSLLYSPIAQESFRKEGLIHLTGLSTPTC